MRDLVLGRKIPWLSDTAQAVLSRYINNLRKEIVWRSLSE